MYLVYEGRANSNNNGALGLATSTNVGSSWTRSGANGMLLNPSSGYMSDELVPDDVVKVDGAWHFVVHGSDAPGPNQPALFTTTAEPREWLGAAFKQVGDDPVDASFHVTPAIADGFQLVYGPKGLEPGKVLANGNIAELIGGGTGRWRGLRSHNNNRSGSWGAFNSNMSVRDGVLHLDPADEGLTPGLQFALVMSTSDLQLTSDFLIAVRRKVTPQTAEGLANIHIGYGGTSNRVNRHVGAFNNGYSLVLTPNRVPHLWEYASSGHTGEDAVSSPISEVENREYSIHEWSYLSDGSHAYTLKGSQRFTAVDTTHLAARKELALTQGNKQSVREGGKSSIDWVYVRGYDGKDMTAAVGAELPMP